MNANLSLALSYYQDSELHTCAPTEEKINKAKSVLEALTDVPIKELFYELILLPTNNIFSSASIPQFSSIDDCFESVIKLMRSGMDGVNFAKMGYFLRSTYRKKGADAKYGENHSKCAELMGLCRVSNGVWRNSYSYAFESLDDSVRVILKPKLCLNIELIRGYFVNGESDEYLKNAICCLSESTQIRRKSNIKTLIEIVERALL